MNEIDPYSRAYARSQGVKDDMAHAAADHYYAEQDRERHGFLKSIFNGLHELGLALAHSLTIHRHRPHHIH